MTLVELLITLLILALIGSAALAAITATVNTTRSQQDVRQAITRSSVVQTRVRQYINSASAFLAAKDDEIVLWSGDTNSDGQVNQDELIMLKRDTSTDTLTRYQTEWPTGWDQDTIDAANTTYAASSNFSSVANALVGSAYFVAEVWSTQVDKFDVTLDNLTPTSAKLITIEIDVKKGSDVETSHLTASLREPIAPTS